MALNFLLKRSGTADKRPDPASMALGELDLNYDATTGGVFYKDSDGGVVKVGSAQVSATAPNATPAGSAGNSTGEFWLDTNTGVLNIWDGSVWVDTAATAISDSSFTAVGEILVGTGASTYTALPVGTNGQILLADSACMEGVKWVTCGGISLLGTTCGSGEAPYTTAFGFQAGDSALSTGFYNVSVGYQAGTNVTSGDYNVALGSFANSGNGSNNTAVGHNAYGNTTSTGLNNVAVGYQALDASTSSSNNTAVGSQALGAVTIGNNNTAVGFNAGTLLTSGPRNTLVGYRAGALLTTGVENTIVGAFEGTGPLSCNVVLANGNGDVRFQANNAGAWSPGGSSYGISGQFLQSAGTGAAPTWSTLPAATTTTAGIVQLNDTTSSTSTTEALTANQGKELQDQINALSIASNITLAGTIDATTGNLVTVTAEGTAAGFTVGDPLPSAASGNDNYFVIVTTPGTMTPPGGSAQECHQGDWWLSDGTAWVFLDVGFNATAATTTTPGVVQLATDAEVQAGLNTDHAVTPSGLQSKVSDSTSTTSSTTLASSTAVKSAYDAGVQGQTDAAAAQTDATQALSDAAAAQSTANAALPLAGGTMTGNIVFNAGQTFSGTVSEQDFQAKGDLVAGFGVNSFGILSAGTDGQVLSANSACVSGLEWVAAGGGGGSGTVTSITAGSGLTGGTITTSGTIAINSACVLEPADFTAKGQILVGTGSGTYCALPAGTNGQILYANSFFAPGVYWGAAPAASNPETLGLTYGCVEGPAPFPNLSCENSSFGYSSMGCNLAGGAFNVAVGNNSAYWMSTGSNNTAVGYTALFSTSGATESSNTAIGYGAMANAGGSRNVAVGENAGYCTGCNNIGGDGNIAIGFNAACLLESGSQNVVIGCGVQPASITGSCQLAIGFASGQCWLSGDSTKAVRPGAGIIDCAGSCGTAGQVLMSNGANAVCWGTAGGGGASPATPTVEGVVLGCTDTTASANTSLGCGSLISRTTGAAATVVGANAGACLTTGNYNTLLGQCAGNLLTTGGSNTVVGGLALRNATTTNNNTAIGYNTLGQTTGINNTALGTAAGTALTTGCYNTFIGGNAGASTTTGIANTVISPINALGSSAPVFNVTNTHNRFVAGHTGITNAYVQVAWTVVSDARDKIVEGTVPHGLEFVKQLEPKTFHFREDRESDTPHGPLRYGFLAQDILALEGSNGVIIDTEDPDKLRYNGESLVPVLVNAIKELSARNDALEARIAALEAN